MCIFSNYTKQLKSRSGSYELTSLMWGHSSLLPKEVEGESLDEASSKHVGGGAITRIFTMESSDEASSWHEGGGAVR
jgi:hypothetical protein